MSDPFLAVEDLRVYHEDGSVLGGPPVRAVDGVSFEIEQGETLGLVGESGCGKTTLARTLMGLEDATGGTVRTPAGDLTDGESATLREWRGRAAMVFQDALGSLDERRTVGQSIREPLDVHDWKTPPERRERARGLLERVGLDREDYVRYPHQLSGGQQQRVAIARALALDPDFLVLDEPVSALDASVQARVLNLLADLQEELGLTYLLVAHDLSVVRHVADRVAVMYLGNLMAVGDADVFDDPHHPYTRALVSAIPEPDPTATAERVTLEGAPPSPRHPPSGCPFATRCPDRIRPGGWNISDDLWERIDTFREAMRERAREAADRPLHGVQCRLGLVHSDIADVRVELFDDVTVPAAVSSVLNDAVARAEQGDPAAASERLREAFGSVCDSDPPDQHDLDDDRWSRCHRHAPEYEDPGDLS